MRTRCLRETVTLALPFIIGPACMHPDPDVRGGFDLTVAPLSLPHVARVCYDLSIVDGDQQPVVALALCFAGVLRPRRDA